MSMERNGAKFTLYAKIGAAQISILPPRKGDAGYISKDGAFLLEAAPGTGPQKWDWDRKISFSIGVADICILMENLTEPKKLIHQKEDIIKKLEFTPGKDNFEGTFMMTLSQKSEGGDWQSVKVPISSGQWVVLTRMFVSMVPHLVGFV